MSYYDNLIAAWYRAKEASAAAASQGITNAANSISGAITQGAKDSTANRIASQMANTSQYDPNTGLYSGYSPRASLVSPGLDPVTGAINAVRPNVSTAGTAPIKMTGGVEGVNIRDAIARTQLAQQGGTPLQQAVERARLAETQAHTNYLNTIPEENRQDRLDKQRQAQQDREDRLQMQENEKNADTIPKLTTEIEKTTGSGTTAKWTQDFLTPYGHRGNVVDGKWVNDQQNGTYYALPKSPDAGSGDNEIPDGTPRDQIGTVTTLDNAQRWKQRAQRIADAGGRYVEPLKPRASSMTPGGGGGQAITTKEQYDALTSGTPFTWNGKPGVKP